MKKYYETYKIVLVVATISGLYFPSIEKIYGSKWYIKLLKVFFIFPAISMPIFMLSSVKFMFFDDAGLVAKMYVCIHAIYAFFCTFTVYSFFYSKNDFERAFELWDSFFHEDLYAEEQQRLLKKNEKFVKGWLKIFGSISLTATSSYTILTFFKPDKTLDHPSGIPYRHQSPDFELMAFLEFLVSNFGFALLIAYDTITLTFFSLEEAAFLHLKYSLGKIVATLKVTENGEFTSEDYNTNVDWPSCSNESLTERELDSRNKQKLNETFEKVEQKIRLWIRYHHQLLRFHDELLKIFFIPLSIKFLVFILLLCLWCFLMVAEGGFTIRDAIVTTCFWCCNYTLFYVIIRYGDSIQDAADSIFEYAFSESWYFYPKNLRTAFHIILMRSNIPVQYTAFHIFPLTARSFLKMYTSAYSFFTVLLHVSRKKN